MGHKPRLKILFDRDSDVGEHARRMIHKLDKAQWESDPRYSPMPKGIAFHTALVPNSCDDCGMTFWARGDFPPHIGCVGVPKKGGNAGF